MRILHTSDWHLGRTLEGLSRQVEQAAFIEELCLLADMERVNLVLVAGDVFDTFNPPAQAEELYCYALEKLTATAGRAVVVIAGNHDSPDRLRAVRALAMRRGAFILGLPGEEVTGPRPEAGVELVAAGPGWLELQLSGVDYPVVISALPYPSEARLQQVLSEDFDERTLRDAYSEAVGGIFARQGLKFRADSVNIATSHLFVMGGVSSESERPIEVGGAYTVAAEHLPSEAQYIALGHLHRPQVLKQAATASFYSGSPLAYSFSEAGQAKSVCLVDVKPGNPAEVRLLPLNSGVPLERWTCLHGVQEALNRLDALQGRQVWLDLEIHSQRYLTTAELSELRAAHSGIIGIRCELTGGSHEHSVESITALSVPEMFVRFYQHKRSGIEPEERLVRLFTDLANQAVTGEAEEKK